MGGYYLKLRNNIILDSDLQLAEKEIHNLFGECIPISQSNVKAVSFIDAVRVKSNTRNGDIIGYLVSSPVVPIHRCAILLSFIQEIWCEGKECGLNDGTYTIIDDTTCVIPMMAMSEFLFYTKQQDVATAVCIVRTLANHDKGNKDILSAINRAKTSAPHIHSFHTYKAKFFPRFVHSLIVSNYDVRKEQISVCDCFVGSGTTLIESALLGHKSVGIDIDELSCFISEVKSAALNMTSNDIYNSAGNVGLFANKSDVRYSSGQKREAFL